MTRTELIEILGSRMICSTKHPAVVELTPGSWFGNDNEKLARMIHAFITTHPRVFFCPHEEWGPGARYQTWDMVEPGAWLVPPTATADDVMHDREYPVGWTLYAASKPLSEADERGQTEDYFAYLGRLVDSGRIAALVSTDPDGSPCVAAVLPQ